MVEKDRKDLFVVSAEKQLLEVHPQSNGEVHPYNLNWVFRTDRSLVWKLPVRFNFIVFNSKAMACGSAKHASGFCSNACMESPAPNVR